jgi:outer membrane murein-binding lipoprotein Lpp
MNDDRIISYTIIGWVFALVLTLLLAGCSRQTPVAEINSEIQTEVTELIDYAQNNMAIDSDKQLLINGARHCAMRAADLTKTCQETVRAYRAETVGWKMAATLMTIIAALLGFLWIKK